MYLPTATKKHLVSSAAHYSTHTNAHFPKHQQQQRVINDNGNAIKMITAQLLSNPLVNVLEH